MKLCLSLAIVTALLLVGSFSAQGGVIENIEACFQTYVNELLQADNQYNEHYGTDPTRSWEKWHEKTEQASLKFRLCFWSALSPNARTFAFPFAAGSGSPTGVIYNFENNFPSNEPVFLTVLNGQGATELVDAAVRLNGAVIVSAAQLASEGSLEVPVTLLPGANEIRFDADPAELGSLFVVVDTQRLSPPN